MILRAFHRTSTVLEMIKFQHTVFALPFAVVGALLAADGVPEWSTLAWILLACVFARTAAMSFNRWADAALDARNPRTADRAIPAGRLSPGFVLAFAAAASVLFVASAAMLNPLAFALSPVALAVLLGYSYTKRFTWASALRPRPGTWASRQSAHGSPCAGPSPGPPSCSASGCCCGRRVST